MTKFEKYFEEQLENFKIYHSNLLKEITEDDIHKLRTTLKRLRTVNIILDGLLFREKDFPKELTKLFKSAGEIRDNQIQQKIFEEYNLKYKKSLLENYKTKISDFNINDSYQNEIDYLIDKMSKVKEYHIDEEIIGNIEARIDVGMDEIRNTTNITSHNLHDVRKKIKVLYYILMMLGIDKAGNNLDELQETIGLWHDYDVALDNIKDSESDSEIVSNLESRRDLLYLKSRKLLKVI